jgi:2-octaprenyl-6-methoxyphenol hydroxylase
LVAASSEAATLAVMRLIDDTGSLFRPPPASFEASEIGLEAFGWSLESATLVERLGRRDGSVDRLILRSLPAERLDLGDRPTLGLADGSRLVADLVVAADGRGSRLRTQAALRTRTWSYPQAALTAIFAHDREHENVSTEFHTRDGPFTPWCPSPAAAPAWSGWRSRRRRSGSQGSTTGRWRSRSSAGRAPISDGCGSTGRGASRP